jgi:hypothetical protein
MKVLKLFLKKSFKKLIPEEIYFYPLGTYLTDGERLVKGSKADGGEVEPKVGTIGLTAKNGFGHDGFAIFLGNINGILRVILWFSQSKAIDGIDRKTGEATKSTLHDGTIAVTILPKMGEGLKRFKEKYPVFKDAFVMYDLFSDRQAPKREGEGFMLGLDEALFVTYV